MQIDKQSVWTYCDTQTVNGVVYLDESYSSVLLYDWPAVWTEGTVNRDLPTITSVLNLEGVQLQWNRTNGFDNSILERIRPVGWQILLVEDTPVIWSQWWEGIETGDFYIFTTDDMDHYVADYGGSNSWHIRCGGWLIDSP